MLGQFDTRQAAKLVHVSRSWVCDHSQLGSPHAELRATKSDASIPDLRIGGFRLVRKAVLAYWLQQLKPK